ncbi:MAG TPA: amidohydrolase family protein [Chitinophagaceae bacterium]|nr:amidohydrolase family protein [Chitinophagaceae bacterium]HPH31286.1 amidohydrolase family protein [Chitinophagaceae bacterium]
MRKLKRLAGTLYAVLAAMTAFSQPTFPENGIADPRHGHFAFTHATLVKDAATTLTDATLVIKDGRIVAAGTGLPVPAGAVEVDCKGKFIYPSFIDIYTDYGTTPAQRAAPAGGGGGFFAQQQFDNAVKGPFGWNQAIKSDVDVYKVFGVNDATAKSMREAGFGTVLTHMKDGVARGTGAVVTLANAKENLVIIKEKASAHYSFNKGTSTQSYPNSLMGYISLLRQTFLDASWYKTKPVQEGFNATLQSWNDIQGLPQIFEANDKWNGLRADRIGDEFGVQYIIKGGQNEYQRIKEVKATNATYILPLNFPQGQDVEDPNDARMVSLEDMKHWEMAPSNAAAFEKAGVPFCLTTSDLRSTASFWINLRKAMEYGLSETKAMDALTKVPAQALGIYDKVGSLEAGKLANFLVTNGPIFSEKTNILYNYVQGIKYNVKDDTNIAGTYNLTINTPAGEEKYTLDVKSNSSVTMWGKDTLNSKFSFDGKQVKLSYAPMARRQRPSMPAGMDSTQRRPGGPGGFGGRGGMTEQPLPASATRLGGVSNGTEWNGTGVDSLGNQLTWTAVFVKAADMKSDSVKKKDLPVIGKVMYPFLPYGWTEEQQPKQETILIKNATVWTSEKDGVLKNTDVLLKNGKISAIGKNLNEPTARVIDGTGKHVSAGIIDEHSHIAAASINEGAQSVTSEVRIGDNLNPEDINIYRQLSGGVTSSHILHGSANVIGGQSQLIKLRWGAGDADLKFKTADGFIKFALGENVKRSSSTQGNNRYPDTRMGVEQVLIDAFTRAKDYKKEWETYTAAKEQLVKAKKPLTGLNAPRRDLELEALVEILDRKRFITCHSYVQSEITGLIEVADKMGFKVNTFTHILEGYKVADKMLKHGANASTFSDWWAYKMEVEDAIPYNAAIMHKVGLNVAINSDDAEMARRLNQEAAKTMKYGGLTAEEALALVTINPAKMLHVDDKVGSIKVGKDADIVLWSDNPLSIYAKSLYTIVDGTVYFDRQKDELLQQEVQAERARLVKKLNGEKRSGAAMMPAMPSYQVMHSCSDHGHSHGLLVVDAEE